MKRERRLRVKCERKMREKKNSGEIKVRKGQINEKNKNKAKKECARSKF